MILSLDDWLLAHPMFSLIKKVDDKIGTFNEPFKIESNVETLYPTVFGIYNLSDKSLLSEKDLYTIARVGFTKKGFVESVTYILSRLRILADIKLDYQTAKYSVSFKIDTIQKYRNPSLLRLLIIELSYTLLYITGDPIITIEFLKFDLNVVNLFNIGNFKALTLVRDGVLIHEDRFTLPEKTISVENKTIPPKNFLGHTNYKKGDTFT